VRFERANGVEKVELFGRQGLRLASFPPGPPKKEYHSKTLSAVPFPRSREAQDIGLAAQPMPVCRYRFGTHKPSAVTALALGPRFG